MQSEATQNGFSHARVGLITSYDAKNYCAKVSIQPDGVETGFLPIFTPWVGNGWGMFCPPTAGDMVLVLFQEGSFEAGLIVLAAYNDADRPLTVSPGEFWLVHSTGSFIKLKNDGSININTNQNLSVTCSGTTNINSTGNVNVTTPIMQVNGSLIVSGDITSTGGHVSDSTGTMANMRSTYNSHDHNDPQGGTTGTANQTM